MRTEKDRERSRRNARAWRLRNPGKEAEAKRRYRASPKGRVASRSADLKKSYGIDADEYERMFDTQKGVCAVCGQPETVVHPVSKKVARLAVDHNHQTGAVRGLLCMSCNMMIGHAREDAKRLLKAAMYLMRYEQEQ